MLKLNSKKIAMFSLLLAIVVVLQVFGSYFRIGTISLSFVLIPIVFGGMVLGPIYGALLGFAFGMVTFIMGLVGADPFTQYLIASRPVLTTTLCIVKATAAGLVSALLFKAISKKNLKASTFIAAIAAPVTNTGLFILGALLMANTINEISGGTDIIYFLFIMCAGINFLIELGLNLILAPSIFVAFKAISKRRNSSWE